MTEDHDIKDKPEHLASEDWANDRFVTKEVMERTSSGLRIEFTQQIAAAINQEIERLKVTVGSAWKVLVLTVAIVMGAGVFFSLKTAYDINQGIAQASQREVAHRLDSDSSSGSSSYRKIVTRAIIDSYLIELARYKIDTRRFKQPPTVDRTTADQLTAVLKDGSASDRDFADVVKVLVTSQSITSGSSDTVGPSPVKTLVDALRASSSEFQWLKEEPLKRATILRGMSTIRDAQTVADLNKIAESTLDSGSEPQFLLAAVAYLKDNGTATEVPKLDMLASRTGDVNLRYLALQALARIDPRSSQLKSYLGSFPGSDTTLAHLAHSLDISGALVQGAPSQSRSLFEEQDPSLNERAGFAEELLSSAIKAGAKFSYVFDTERNSGQVFVYKGTGGSYQGVSPQLFVLDAGNKVIEHVLERAADNGTPEFGAVVSALRPFSTSQLFDDKPIIPHITISDLPSSGFSCGFPKNAPQMTQPELEVKSDGKLYCLNGDTEAILNGSAKRGSVVVKFSFDKNDKDQLAINDDEIF
jgi:hypothetical protein